MQYHRIPHSALEVSVLGLGTMTFGEQNSEIEAHQQLDYAIASGINLIDTAASNSGVLLRCISMSASLHISCSRNHFCFWPIHTGFVSQRTKRFGNL